MLSLPATLAALQEATPLGTVWDYLRSGGPVMVPIGICSVIAVALVLERALNLTRRKVSPPETESVLELVAAGRTEEALELSERIAAPSGRILAAAIRRRGFPVREVEHAMEDQGAKELARLRANIRPLSLIGNIAPLLGLLGTVVGIEECFSRVVKSGLGKPEHLAAGIETALITTIAGLAVAIPVLVCVFWLTAKVQRLLLDLDQKLSPVVERLAAEPERGRAA
jgi:biopolymer transport protein ExbB